MSNKALILSLYFVALFIVLKNYYNQPGNSGMPYPTVITGPTYLYAVLGLVSDFTGGLATVLAAGLTLGLFYRTHKDPASKQGKGYPSTSGPGGTRRGKEPVNTPAVPKAGTVGG